MTFTDTEQRALDGVEARRAAPPELQAKIDGLADIIREHANTGLTPRGCHAAPNPCAMCVARAEREVRGVIKSASIRGYLLRKLHGSPDDTATTLLESAGTEIV